MAFTIDKIRDPVALAEYYLLNTKGEPCGITTELKKYIVELILEDNKNIELIHRYIGIPIPLLRAWVTLYTNNRLCMSIKEQLYNTYDKIISPISKAQFNKEIRKICIIYQNRYRHSIDQFRMYYEYIHKTKQLYTDFIMYDNDINNIYQYITECITDYIVDNTIEFTTKSKYIPIQYMTIQDSINIIKSRITNLNSLYKKLQYDTTKKTDYRVYMFDRIPKNISVLLNLIMSKSIYDQYYLQNILKDYKPKQLLAQISSGVLCRTSSIAVYKQIVCMDGYFYLVPSHIKHIISQTNWDWEIVNIEDSGISLINLSKEIYEKVGIENTRDVDGIIESGLHQYITFKHCTYLNLDMYVNDMFEDSRAYDNSETLEFRDHYSRLMDLAIRTNPEHSVLDMVL